MSRYLCLHCWRTPSEREVGDAPDLVEVLALPVAPVQVVESAVVETPAARRPSLPWLHDPNATTVPVAPTVASPPAPGPAQPVKKARSGFVEMLFGEDERGGGAAGRGAKLCPCGALLSPDARLDGDPALLGIAGARSAGKTVLLLAMLHQLEVEDAGYTLLGLGDTEERIRRLRQNLFGQRRQPLPTEAELPASVLAAPNSFCWQLSRAGEIQRQRREPASTLFGVFDVAGESWQDLRPHGNRRLFRYLDLLGRLVFVVDGAVVAADLGLDGGDAWSGPAPDGDLGAADLQIFRALVDHLGGRAREIPLSIVITKADLFWSAERWAGLAPAQAAGEERAQLTRDLLKASFRGNLWQKAQERFRRVGLYAVSALGFRPEEHDVDPNRRLARPPAPHDVLPPLEFLLEGVLKGRA